MIISACPPKFDHLISLFPQFFCSARLRQQVIDILKCSLRLLSPKYFEFSCIWKKCFESENISLDMMRGNTGGPVGISKSYFLNTFNFVFRKIFIEFIIVITILMWLIFLFFKHNFPKIALTTKNANFLSTFKFLVMQVFSKLFHDIREMSWEFRET